MKPKKKKLQEATIENIQVLKKRVSLLEKEVDQLIFIFINNFGYDPSYFTLKKRGRK